MLLTNADSDRAEPNNETKLVFDRDGKDNFLAEVWVAGLDEGRAVPQSERQRERLESMTMERKEVPLRKQ